MSDAISFSDVLTMLVAGERRVLQDRNVNQFPKVDPRAVMHFDHERGRIRIALPGREKQFFAQSDIQAAAMSYLVHARKVDGKRTPAGRRSFAQISASIGRSGDPKSLKNWVDRWDDMWNFVEARTPTAGPWRIALPPDRIVADWDALAEMFSGVSEIKDAERPVFDPADPAVLEEIESLVSRGAASGAFGDRLERLLSASRPGPIIAHVARAAWIDGLIAFRRGDVVGARAFALRIVTDFVATGSEEPVLLGNALNLLGACEYREGHFLEASGLFEFERQAVRRLADRHGDRVRARAFRCSAIVEMRSQRPRSGSAFALRAQRAAASAPHASEYWLARGIEMMCRLTEDPLRHGSLALRQLERAIALVPATDAAASIYLRRLYFEALVVMQDPDIDTFPPEWRALFDDGRVSAADLATAILRDGGEIGSVRDVAVVVRHLRASNSGSLHDLLTLVDEPLRSAIDRSDLDNSAVAGTRIAEAVGKSWQRSQVHWERVRGWVRSQENPGIPDWRRAGGTSWTIGATTNPERSFSRRL